MNKIILTITVLLLFSCKMSPNTADEYKKEIRAKHDKYRTLWHRSMERCFYDSSRKYGSIQDFIAGADWKASQPSNAKEGWIDVKERLPGEHEKVLVHLANGQILLGVMGANEWAIYWSDGLMGYDSERPVTHWILLPAPPQSNT